MQTYQTPLQFMLGNVFKHLAGQAQGEYGRRVRRSYPIHFYSGRNGAAKSLAAVYDTMPDLEAGLPVLSTVRLLDYKNPRPCDDPDCLDLFHGTPNHMAAHPSYVPFTTWKQLLDWDRGTVIMDEITGVADSNSSAAIPDAAANHLAQLRRADCAVRITGLNFVRANKRIREATTAVTRCTSMLPVTAFHDDGSERMWKARRFAKWRTYDAQSLPINDVTESAFEKADQLGFSTHWIPTSPAIAAYDTMAPVSVVGRVTESGRCANCEGVRRAQQCDCPDYLHQLAAAKTARSGTGVAHEH